MLEDILGRIERMEIKGVSIDSRTIKKGELFVALKGDRFDGHDFVVDAVQRGAWGALVDRTMLESRYDTLGGISNIIPVEDTLLSLQEIAATHRKKFSIPVVGITGSNGKTTTKEMLASILHQQGPVLKNEGNLNNHIGVPLTLLKLAPEHTAAVVEMGMSGFGEIETLTRLTKPTVGVITNIGPAHLQFLGSTDSVAKAKGELLENLDAAGTAVLNADDRYHDTLRKKFGGKVLTFGIDRPADVTARDVRQGKNITDLALHIDGRSVPVRLRVLGRHNVYNALAAAAAATAIGLPLESIKFGIEAFVPISMRSEIRQVQGRIVIADYYNANPASVEAALKTLVSLQGNGKIVAVLGDMLELGKAAPDAHRDVGAIAARLGVDLLITLGSLAAFMIEGAVQAGMARDSAIAAPSHAEAARLLRERTRSGDTVLIKGSRGMKMETILEEF